MGAMRFAVATLGCKVNQYDSAMIESRLGARGMVRCKFDEVADVYIVNTCTVTDRADAESLKLARRARRLNPRARVLMTGCLAQANPGVLAAASEIDAVIGLGRPDDLERAALGEVGDRVMVSNLRCPAIPVPSSSFRRDAINFAASVLCRPRAEPRAASSRGAFSPHSTGSPPRAFARSS
jgi:threonylcarbamoyladenosine tRNA methylthiotransferase MtaB